MARTRQLRPASNLIPNKNLKLAKGGDTDHRKLTMHGGFHPKSSTLRLYASRKEGGRGLVSVKATVQDETSKIHKYIKDKAPTDDVLSECLRQEPSWKDKPVHGMYHLNITEVLIVGSWLNMTGAVIRFLGAALPEYDASSRYPVVLLGQAISALAQPLIIFTPTKLAALWFPVHQRTTANMLASMCEYPISPDICLLATVGVRSSVPPTSPSPSAQSSPEPFLQGLKLLVKNRAYLVLMLCLGSGIASFTCFSSLLDQILCVQGYSNEFAGLCGALFIIWGIVGAGLLGVYVDRTKKFIEVTKINLSLSSVACAAFSVVALMPGQQAAVAVVCSLFGFFGFSVYPVAMELSVECSYPVGEATSAGLIFASGQVQSVLYMFLLQSLTTPLAPTPGSMCGEGPQSWRVPLMLLAGLCAFFTSVFVLFFRSRYRRLEAEEQACYGSKEGPVTSNQEPPTGYDQEPPNGYDQGCSTIGPDQDHLAGYSEAPSVRKLGTGTPSRPSSPPLLLMQLLVAVVVRSVVLVAKATAESSGGHQKKRTLSG
uniref:Solute carrier family 49 member 3 n=1 Tax=Periophthalmus magnuspinnatus TaxID=409849 RepID=A0A3B4BA40_9GOBI